MIERWAVSQVREEEIVAEKSDAAVEALAHRIEAEGVSIAVAESLTGGGIAAKLACAPGSSEWFRGGIVAYSSGVKHELLDVPDGPVVSEAAARAMATGAAQLLGADVAVGVTGVGGPDEQDGEPPGTVWMGLHHGGSTDTRLFNFSGEPPEVVDATVRAALSWLSNHLAPAAGAT
jgi:nicotinamide-nucleotide amidase